MALRMQSRSWVAALSVVTAAALLVGCGQDSPSGPDTEDPVATGDWEPEWVDGVLQPLPDGFPNKPIVMVSRGDPGSRNGILMRQLFNVVEGMAPRGVRLEDAPLTGLGAWEELDQLNHLDSDGYRVMIVALAGSAVDSLIEPVHEMFDLTMDDYNPVLRMETQPYVLVQRKNAPWGDTFDEMVEYAKSNPGELRYISNQVGSGHDILMMAIMKRLGMEVVKIPAASQGDAITVVGAGEGDFTTTSVDLALQHWEADRVDVTMVTGDVMPPQWAGTNAVTAADALNDPLWSIDLALLTASDAPDLHRQWLYELFSTAVQTSEYVAQREQLPGVQIAVLDHDEAKKLATDFLKAVEPTIRDLEMHWEDK